MIHNIQVSISKGILGDAKHGHKFHRSMSVVYETEYYDFYLHCIRFFGCEITCNEFGIIDFRVAYPEKLELDVEDCIKDFNFKLAQKPTKKGFNVGIINDLIVYVLIFSFGIWIGWIL